MHFTEYSTRVAAYAVIVRDGEILLSWYNGESRPEKAGWTLPGGGVDFDEQIEDGLVREVFEETGYTSQITGFLTTDSFTADDGADGRPFRAVRIVFMAAVTGGELGTTEVDGSTDYAAWHPIADIPFPHTRLVDTALDALERTSAPHQNR